MVVSRYLADKSALARLHLPPVQAELAPLITQGLVAVCEVTELELLFSARNLVDYERIRDSLIPSFTWVPIGDEVWRRALEVQHALAAKGQHRGPNIPDLLVAAGAEAAGLTLLHYDRDFETIAAVTSQPVRWVVPPGTV